MRSIVAVGDVALNFANYLQKYPEFSIYTFAHTGAEFKIPVFKDIERYEDNIKGLKKYLSTVADDVTFVVSGSEPVSLISLQVLQLLVKKNVDIVYLQPDLDVQSETGQQLHNLVFGALQEKTRSHVFKEFTVFDLAEVKKVSTAVLLGSYKKQMAETCAQHWQTFQWLSSEEPVFEISEQKIKNAVISSISYCDFSLTNVTKLGNLLFTREREVLYGIPEKRINEDTELHNEIVNNFKEFKEEDVRTSVRVFSVPFENEIVYVRNSTTAVQNKLLQETVDKQGKQ